MVTSHPIRTYICLVAFAGFAFAQQPALDESPARPGEWGYRPADASESSLNPPGFTWRPTRGIARYTLQIARDPAFQDVVYERGDVRWSAHCPDIVLEAGAYYWRYRGHGESGDDTNWSRTRTFSVKADSVKAPLPKVDELVKRMPSTHPRVFFRPEDVGKLRELAKTTLADRWEKLVQDADKMVASPPDASEPPKYPDGVTREDAQWKEIWWGNRLRTIAVADGAATLGFVYQLSGEAKYARAARELLLALASWDPEGSTEYQYNDEAAMPFLKMTSRAYSWNRDALSDADRAAIISVMRVRGAQCYRHLTRREHLWNPYASHSNRAWHFLGEVAVAFYDEIPEAKEWLEFAMTVLYTAYPVWSDEDGGWHEGTGYWASYQGRFQWWAAVCDSMFGIDVFERPFFQRTGYFGMYLMPPGSRTGGFADMGRDMGSERIAPLEILLAAGARNPHWLWYAKQEGQDFAPGYFGFLCAARASELKAEPPAELPSSACFRGVGIAALNTDLMDGTKNIQVLFKSSPMGRQSHGYNANNAFIVNVGGREALSQSGRRDLHGSKHHTQWMWHSRSDNSVLVNYEGQVKHSPASRGEIVAFDTSPSVDVVVGEAAHSYEQLDRFTRRIVFFKPGLVLIHDILEAKEPSTFQWTLHAPGEFAIEGNDVAWRGDARAVRLRFLEPAGLVLTQTDRFEPPPADWANFKLADWHLTADAQEKSTHREFVTVIAAKLGAEVPELPEIRAADREAGEREYAFEIDSGPVSAVLSGERFHVTAPGYSRSF
ncbi:MAG: heparinase [Candidatus Hydrogenedentota bacterium]